MDIRSVGKSRKEKRKEAQTEKKNKKLQSWIQHQKSGKLNSRDVPSKDGKRTRNSFTQNSEQRVLQENGIHERDHSSEQHNLAKKSKQKLDYSGYNDFTASRVVKRKNGLERNLKTKFEEYLEMGMQTAAVSAEEDLKLERKLAKKLKVKEGKLRGLDDGINILFEGISDFEEFPLNRSKSSSSSKKHKKRKSSEQGPKGKVAGDVAVGVSDPVETFGSEVELEEVPAKAPSGKKCKRRKLSEQGPDSEMEGDSATGVSEAGETWGAEVALEEVPAPALEGNVKYVVPQLRSHGGNEFEEYFQVRRQVRGLLNKLSDSYLESVTMEMSKIFHSVGRSVASQIIIEEGLASFSHGPRLPEQDAAVFAAFVAGMACLVGIEFSAKLIASVAKSFEDEYLEQDNISLGNLTSLLSFVCLFGICSSDLIYDLLIKLSKRLVEIDVTIISKILKYCGMKLRSDDPAAMKVFILSVQNRVNELKASSGDGQEKINKRMETLLDEICEIKNNKKSSKEDPARYARIKKWLQQLNVQNIFIRGLTWSKLLDPDKKGQWWLCGDSASTMNHVEEVASSIDREVLEAQKMLQLAASQRMNTDARKAIFCIIMSGEDYIDAFEKLLRLDLPGKQDREIMRVLVDCCLQEKVFNKYYAVLASKLCNHDKNHKFSLQYCLWDLFKELESMQLIKSMHLARFVAEMLGSFSLSLAVLKTAELSDTKRLTPKRIMHFRMLFEVMFEYSDRLVWNIFTRVAVTPELETFRNGIEFFINEYVVSTNKAIAKKFKVAKKALNNVEGVLM